MTEITENEVRVTLEHFGEGYWGEFDLDDPNDAPLLRFDVYLMNPFSGDWEPVDDASYCTLLTSDIPLDRQNRIVQLILDEIAEDVRSGISIKRKCESLSWVSVVELDGMVP